MRLWEIGELARRATNWRDCLRLPFMQDSSDATRRTCTLRCWMPRGPLHRKDHGRRATRVVTRAGGRLPLHATGVGKALLRARVGRTCRRSTSSNLKRYTATHHRCAGTACGASCPRCGELAWRLPSRKLASGPFPLPHRYFRLRARSSPRWPSSSDRAARTFSGWRRPFGRTAQFAVTDSSAAGLRAIVSPRIGVRAV